MAEAFNFRPENRPAIGACVPQQAGRCLLQRLYIGKNGPGYGRYPGALPADPPAMKGRDPAQRTISSQIHLAQPGTGKRDWRKPPRTDGLASIRRPQSALEGGRLVRRCLAEAGSGARQIDVDQSRSGEKEPAWMPGVAEKRPGPPVPSLLAIARPWRRAISCQIHLAQS
ncbi:hypothetical protein [Tistrella mobilis]|uniref:hypothetical protein n=1 Tax=Tistrella mobilis TaxID=171437 RepID=UPI003555CBF6